MWVGKGERLKVPTLIQLLLRSAYSCSAGATSHAGMRHKLLRRASGEITNLFASGDREPGTPVSGA